MKYISIVITFLVTLNSYSQKHQGTITLIDGTVITGIIKVTDNLFKYQQNENSETIKYDYTTAIAATFTNNKNEEMKFEFVYVDYKEKPFLLEIVKDGFLKLYVQDSSHFTSNVGFGINTRTVLTYFLKRTTDKLGQYFIAVGYLPKIPFDKVIESYFTDCPLLQQKVASGEFKKKHMEEIVKFYNENCAPK